MKKMRKLTQVKPNLPEGRSTTLDTRVVPIQRRKKPNIGELEKTREKKTTLARRREDNSAAL